MKRLFVLLMVVGLWLAPNISGEALAVPQNDVVGYWTMEFMPGFNLVSFPVLPDNPSPQNVIGDALGAVEVTTWDRGLGDFRYARYNPETGNWSGDLYLLNRGVAYWVNLLNSRENQRLIVTGKPELYTKFHWSKLRTGWDYYAPVYGKAQTLADLPPEDSGDILVSWEPDQSRFLIAGAEPELRWDTREFDTIQPDRAYILNLNRRTLRNVGPPTRSEFLYEKNFTDSEGDKQYHNGDFYCPPWPLVIGNKDGLPVCDTDGGVCNGGYAIDVIRESIRIGVGGELEPWSEQMAEFTVEPGNSIDGKFRTVLTVCENEGFINPGDRIYLVAHQQGRETRSNSFEVPVNERFVMDLSFPEPMATPGSVTTTPVEFTLNSPYPNPFNDRFQIEMKLPETAPVKYSLFDVQGRRIMSSVRPLSAGVHRLSFKADNMSAGVYLVEVVSGTHRGLAKVAYVK